MDRHDKIYGTLAHKQLAARADLLRDRGLNFFTAIESLEKAIPAGPRFERLRDHIQALYTTMDIVFATEDRIEDEVNLLEGSVGR
jgi:hypothetical protein